MSVAEFVGAGWPRTHTRGRKQSTLRNYSYSIQPLVRDFGDRLLRDGIGRREARAWTSTVSDQAVRVAALLFSDAIDDELADMNPFAGLRLPTRRGRKDIDVLSVDELDLLCVVPLEIWPNAFGETLSVLVRWQAETCMRPAETRGCSRTWALGDADGRPPIVVDGLSATACSRRSLDVHVRPRKDRDSAVLQDLRALDGMCSAWFALAAMALTVRSTPPTRAASRSAMLTLPDELLDEFAERVAVRVAALLAERAVDEERWLDADQAAEYLGCAWTRIYDLERREKLAARRDGRRMLFRKSDLDAAVA